MTGSREGMSIEAQEYLVKFVQTVEIEEAHHGDCVGADKIFHDIVTNYGIKTIIHPPVDKSMRAYCKGDIILPPENYLVRNKNMVDETDMLITFPRSRNEELRSGTWSTIRYAKKQNKNLILVYPDGQSDCF